MSLAHIDHIVVLMLENRSFDHMLGYLRLDQPESGVDGLTGLEENTYGGVTYYPEHLTETVFEPDPLHDWDAVQEQMEDGNKGFVRNFANRARSGLGRVMGYHNATEVPVFDLLARRYCVCDRWFSSVPGATQPNRFYAIAGTSEGRKGNSVPPTLRAPTVFHELSRAGVSWRYYSHDIAFLRAHKEFRRETDAIRKVAEFFKATRDATLPAVCWIDPDFGLKPFGPRPNSDHPPQDVWEGQRLVGRIYNALLEGANDLFERVMFIVTYDEHGGFHDHVPPGEAEDDHPDFRRYGIRVPALVVSAWTSEGWVCHETFDHTSIVKTILERFCVGEDGGIPDLGARVAAASNLAATLDLEAPVTIRPLAPVLHPNLDIVRRETLRNVVREPTDLEIELSALREECLARGITDEEL